METLNANTKGKVLIPTNDRKYPFLIKLEDDCYLLVKSNGTLTGDGFYKSELAKYCPNAELEMDNDKHMRIALSNMLDAYENPEY
jgi:hypothetical protein